VDTSSDSLRGPLPASGGVPLRVAAYIRISDAIRSGALPRASLLPSEAELVELLGVSRTVIREALIFLEEDGLIRSRRGIGRFVSEQIPRSGIERVQPPEIMLAGDGTATIERTLTGLQETTAALVTDALGLAERDPSWLAESVVQRDGTVVGLVQEHLPAPDALTGPLAPVAAALEKLSPDQTVLAALLADPDLRHAGNGTTVISVGTAGASRARLLGVADSDPILVLTRRLRLADRPFYLSKTLVNQQETHVSIAHTTL
jgi:GntR family transcriptional regulator